MEEELWFVNSELLRGKLTPDQAAQRIQDGFSSWYEPQNKNAKVATLAPAR